MGKVLTVSIAAYNVENYISETLDSLIIKNNLDDLEILIIDDGATDRTAGIAQRYEARYPGVFKLIRKENGGWGSTVNIGLHNASGKYFKQLDGDDYFDNENLDRYIDFLRNAEEDLIISPYILFDDKTKGKIPQNNFNDLKSMQYPTTINRIAGYYEDMNMHAACFKTKMLRGRVNIEEHCFYTDIDLMIQACALVNSVNYFPEVIYCYRVSREGQSCSFDGYIRHYQDHYRIALKCLENAYTFSGDEIVRQMLVHRSELMASNQYTIAMFSKPSKEMKTSILNFDTILKERYGESYRRLNRIISIRCLRLFQFRTLLMLHYVWGIVRWMTKSA